MVPPGRRIRRFTLMSTWKQGRADLEEQLASVSLPARRQRPEPRGDLATRTGGTAIFMTSHTGGVPPALRLHLKHYKMRHERVILVSVLTASVPTVPSQERLSVNTIGDGLFRVIGHYGFMETPDIPALLASLPQGALPGPRIEEVPHEVTYYLGRDTFSRVARDACRPGASGSSSSWRGMRRPRAPSSACPRTASWRWARGSSSGYLGDVARLTAARSHASMADCPAYGGRCVV